MPISEIFSSIHNAAPRLQGDGGVFGRFVDKHKLDELEFWLLTRFRYFPGSITAKDFLTFGPYTSLSKYKDALKYLADKTLTESTGDSRYRLTDSARKSIEETYHKYFARVARVNVLDDEEAERLNQLIDLVYRHALRQVDVPVPILNAVHSTMPDSDSTWVQIERRLVGLQIFREDAYIAAWRDAGYSGARIEVSSALFERNGGLSHDELRANTPRLDDNDFLSALSALHSGDEVKQREGRYKLSKSGHAAQQAIEDATDENYAAPFEPLERDQIGEIVELLKKIAGSGG